MYKIQNIEEFTNWSHHNKLSIDPKEDENDQIKLEIAFDLIRTFWDKDFIKNMGLTIKSKVKPVKQLLYMIGAPDSKSNSQDQDNKRMPEPEPH